MRDMPPFFVVGTGRCGTTMLWEALNLHDDLFVLRESHWIPKMFEHFGTGTGTAGELADIVLRTRFVSGDRVYPGEATALRRLFATFEEVGVAEFCDRVGTMLAEQAGKHRWADKTPDYGGYMGMLQVLWPDCRFVHLIRDGLEVAQSMSRHPGYRWLAAAGESWWVPASFNDYYRSVPSATCSLAGFAALWCRRLRRIRDEYRRLRPGSYLEIRFEDLLGEPGRTLAEVAAFVDLEPDNGWLASATAVPDRGRPRSSPNLASLDDFGDSPRRLLAELGYLP